MMQERVNAEPKTMNEDTQPAPEVSPCMRAMDVKEAMNDYIKDLAPEETPCTVPEPIKIPEPIKNPEESSCVETDIIKSDCDKPLQKEEKELEQEEKQEPKKRGSKWEEFPVEKWRSAVYVNRAYFGQLCDDQVDFVVQFAEQLKLLGNRVSLVEVGCGTGEFIRDTADNFRVAVGVDFNPHFIAYCNHEMALLRRRE